MRGLIEGLENPHGMLSALPAVYHEDDFAGRLTRVFDEALAPVINTLDNLDAYADPSLAPLDFVEWLGRWVGFPIGETWPEERARLLVGRAVELYRWSGTVRGLKALLATYAGLEPEVSDTGGVWWATTPGTETGPEPGGGRSKSKPATKNSSKGKGTAKSQAKSEGEDRHREPHVTVKVRARGTGGVDRRQLEALINAAKPAHVTYTLEVQG